MSVVFEQLKKALDSNNLQLAREYAAQLAAEVRDETVYLCNITDVDWGPYNMWQDQSPAWIRGKQPGEEFSLYRVTNRTAHIDMGDGKTLPVAIAARDRANDIANIVNGGFGEGAFFGVFVCAGDKPSREELADAKERLGKFYSRLVEGADNLYQQPNGLRNISELHRRAAGWLGIEKPWLHSVKMQEDCPACGSKIPPNVAVCRHCGAILDSEKAAQFQIRPSQPEPEPQPVIAQAAAEPARTRSRK